MFKKSKKFVITGLVAGAIVAGGGFAAASYAFGINQGSGAAQTLATKVADLTQALTGANGVIADLTASLQGNKQKHEADMQQAQTQVKKANATITSLNTAIDSADQTADAAAGDVKKANDSAASVQTTINDNAVADNDVDATTNAGDAN